MYNTTKIILILFLALFILCREKNPTDMEARQAKRNSLQKYNEPVNFDSLFTVLISIENALIGSPKNLKYIDQFIHASFQASEQCFYVIGRGEMPDTSKELLDNESLLIKQKQDARKSSEKWALYCKALLNNKSHSPINSKAKIPGKIMYRKMIKEEMISDTLYQLYKIPITSVVLW